MTRAQKAQGAVVLCSWAVLWATFTVDMRWWSAALVATLIVPGSGIVATLLLGYHPWQRRRP